MWRCRSRSVRSTPASRSDCTTGADSPRFAALYQRAVYESVRRSILGVEQSITATFDENVQEIERPSADPHDRLKHDGQYRALEAEEQRRDDTDATVEDIDPAQRHDRDRAGNNEQHAGDDAALRPVHQPADVCGELLRLWPWQQHAIVERVEEPLLADPSPLLDQHAVHHRDLAGRAAERKDADTAEDSDQLSERRRGRCGGRFHRQAAFAGQLCRSAVACLHQP